MHPSSERKEAKNVNTCLEVVSDAINAKLEVCFGRLAEWVSLRPRAVIVFCVTITLICGAGFSKFRIVIDPDTLYTPRAAQVVDDNLWYEWFKSVPLGVPAAEERRRTSFISQQAAARSTATSKFNTYDDDMGVPDVVETGATYLKMLGFDPDLMKENIHDVDHPLSVLTKRRKLSPLSASVEEARKPYGERKETDMQECEMDNFAFYRGGDRPREKGYSNLLDNNCILLRKAIEINAAVMEHFGMDIVCWDSNGIPSLEGVGKCWHWDLAEFDADENRVATLSQCIDQDSLLEHQYMSGVEKDLHSGKIEKVTGVIVSMWYRKHVVKISQLDEFVLSMQDEDISMGALSWVGINDAILAALMYDMPLIGIPILILTVYVCHIFYRPNSDSHMTLAFAGMANVLLAVISGAGIVLLTGSPFTALHSCAAFITLGIGIDDAFIITSAVYNAKNEHRKLGTAGPQDIGTLVKIGLARCGPSILLTSLTDFCAFISNISSNIFAIRNFALVAAIMVFIDFVLQVTFFVACIVVHLRKSSQTAFKPSNAGDKICESASGDEVKGEAHSNVNRVNDGDGSGNCNGFEDRDGEDRDGENGSLDSKETSGSPSLRLCSGSQDERGQAGVGGTDGIEAESYSKSIMSTLVYSVILNFPGKIAVLIFTATIIMIGFLGSSKLSVTYNPYLFIPEDSYVHIGRRVMDEHFPWILNEKLVCAQMSGADFSQHQDELKEIGKFSCANASRGMCFDWYALFRIFVSAKYVNDEEAYNAMLDEDGYLKRVDFYRELKDYSMDETFGGKEISDMFLRWQSETEIAGIRSCFMWQQHYNIPVEIEWMIDKRQEVLEIAPNLQPALYNKYFFMIEPLTNIVAETLKNFSIISVVVIIVCMLVLANVKATALVIGSVITIELIVLGSLHFFGLEFNMVSSIMLIVGVGLCVDFSAHSAHAFLHSKKRRPHEKVRDALDKVGISIWNGAFSTLLAMLPMSICKSYFITTWWKCISLVIILGIFYGLYVIPVLLTIFDDESEYDELHAGGFDDESSTKKSIGRTTGPSSTELELTTVNKEESKVVSPSITYI